MLGAPRSSERAAASNWSFCSEEIWSEPEAAGQSVSPWNPAALHSLLALQAQVGVR